MLSMRTTAPVWRVDHLPVAEIDPDVAEAVEEDEVAGLSRGLGDRQRRVPLGDRVMRQRDAELRVDVHHEAGAVETARACSSPDVGDAEIPQRDLGRLRV